MGCDIHLRLERRRREPKVFSEYYTEGTEWQGCAIFGYDGMWSDRLYGMFAKLADVRNYTNEEHLPLRGYPEDTCESTTRCYTCVVLEDDEYREQGWAIPRSEAEKCVANGWSKWMKVDGDYPCVTCPDWHSPNWCTTQEMEECVNRSFHDNGKWIGDYEEWVALLWAMKGYESTGEYECRAVFWFDN